MKKLIAALLTSLALFTASPAFLATASEGGVRLGFLNRNGDDVADPGVPGLKASQNFNTLNAFGAAVIGNYKLTSRLYHLISPLLFLFS